MTAKRPAKRATQHYNPEWHGHAARAAAGRPAVTLLLTTEARDKLRGLAEASGESMSAIVTRLVMEA